MALFSVSRSLRADAADLLQGLELALEQSVHHLADLLPLVGEPDAHRAAVGGRALMIDVAGIDQLLEIVGDVRAEIVAAAGQLAGGQLGIADIVEQ